MAGFIHQLAPVVLAVDIHQQQSQFLHLGSRDRHAADPAAALPVGTDAPLEDQLVLGLDLVLCQPCFTASLVEHGGNGAFIGAAAYQFTAHTAAKNGADGVNDNGFAGAGLAGEHVEAAAKTDVGLLDYRNILYVKFV